MSLISIIHPSRGRPEKSFNTLCYWNKHYSGLSADLEIIVSIDNNDPLYHEYKKLHNGNVISNENKSAVDAINNAAKVAKGDIFIVVSDDTFSSPGWNRNIYESVKGHGVDWILKTQDGIQPWIITMPIMDRAYYNRFGYIYHPDFKHMFCDTFLTCVADLTDRKITSNLMFKHNHYSITKNAPDEINKRADATWKDGEETFFKLARQNFLLKPEDIKGKINDPNYLNWMNKRI